MSKSILPYWFAIFGVLLVLVGGCASPLDIAMREGLNNEIFSKEPMEIASISVKWAKDKTADAATGEFTVKAKATENLYKLADYNAGLKKLGITKLYEKEYNDAYGKFQGLPATYQSDLRRGVPQGLSGIRFYELLVPQGNEVTLTGSVELTKHVSGKWLVGRFLLYPFSCGDVFTPESKLKEEEYKLDAPQTKAAIESIIKKREKFAAEVEPVWAEWKQQQQQEAEEARRKSQLEWEQRQQAGGSQQTTALAAGVVRLSEELRKSGFSGYGSLRNFIQYGSKRLSDRWNEENSFYSRADAFDKAAAQKRVDAVQSEISAAQMSIAKITFWDEYPYSTSNVTVHGDRSNCTITIDTGFSSSQIRGGLVSFPVPSVGCDVVKGVDFGVGVSLSVNGSTDSIQELVRNSHHYRARVQFKNLRYQSYYTAADLLKIDIIKVGEPQEPSGGAMIDDGDNRRRGFPRN